MLDEMKRWLSRIAAERALKRRYQSLTEAWSAASESELGDLAGTEEDHAELREKFLAVGGGTGQSYRVMADRAARAVGSLWLDATLVLLVVLLYVGIRGDLRGGGRVVTTAAVPLFGTLQRDALAVDTRAVGLGGYGTIEAVEGRVAVRRLPVSMVLRPGDLSPFVLGPAERDLLAVASVLSLPLSGAFDGVIVPGRPVDLLAVAGPQAIAAGQPACQRFDRVLVLAIEPSGSGTIAVVGVARNEVGRLAAALAQQGGSFRPVAGRSGEGC